VERIQLRDLKVKKKSGQTEPFDRNKIKKSLQIACRKRDISDERIEAITSSLHRQLEADAGADDVVASETIGNIVSEALQTLDPIAFIRFASVYKQFSEVSEFKKIIADLSDKPKSANADKFKNGRLF